MKRAITLCLLLSACGLPASDNTDRHLCRTAEYRNDARCRMAIADHRDNHQRKPVAPHRTWADLSRAEKATALPWLKEHQPGPIIMAPEERPRADVMADRCHKVCKQRLAKALAK